MTRAILVLRAISGVLFLTQLTLGILFWTGHTLSLIPLHMLLGSLFVLSLLTLAVLSARAGAPRGPVVALGFLAVVILAVGFAQTRLVAGPNHWMIRVVHLGLAAVAMPLAGRLPTMLPSAPRRFRGDSGPSGPRQGAGSAPERV